MQGVVASWLATKKHSVLAVNNFTLNFWFPATSSLIEQPVFVPFSGLLPGDIEVKHCIFYFSEAPMNGFAARL